MSLHCWVYHTCLPYDRQQDRISIARSQTDCFDIWVPNPIRPESPSFSRHSRSVSDQSESGSTARNLLSNSFSSYM